MTMGLFGDLGGPKKASGTIANLSGQNFEDQVRAKLSLAGYRTRRQVEFIPSIYGVGKKRIDILVIDPGIIVSCKNQESYGSAEEKLWGEIVQLQHICDIQDAVKEAWLILGGSGMRHTFYWLSRDWMEWVRAPRVKVYHLETWDLDNRLI